jgi:hypothetical protein
MTQPLGGSKGRCRLVIAPLSAAEFSYGAGEIREIRRQDSQPR